MSLCAPIHTPQNLHASAAGASDKAWDVFAISTYFSVSLVFWYIGLIPDFATIRDRAKNAISKAVYGALSFGWDGAAKTWSRYEVVALVLAGWSCQTLSDSHAMAHVLQSIATDTGWDGYRTCRMFCA